MQARRHKRRLIPQPILRSIAHSLAMGVPLSRTMRDHNIDASRTHLFNLLNWHNLLTQLTDSQEHAALHQLVSRSLFPSWLDNNIANAQEPPEGWGYIGAFPYGSWSCQTRLTSKQEQE